MNYAEIEQGKPLYRRTRNFYGGNLTQQTHGAASIFLPNILARYGVATWPPPPDRYFALAMFGVLPIEMTCIEQTRLRSLHMRKLEWKSVCRLWNKPNSKGESIAPLLQLPGILIAAGFLP